ncbi:MAG: DUF1343 domain-containing protein [candidate division KSB1 bacterium]|nr:DUF1343 domain-containing protein [candidate division KSB1 bacterium]MDZ7317721.1 DUF1343 domain-containing protein [candidate division KSB1 bacterium]
MSLRKISWIVFFLMLINICCSQETTSPPIKFGIDVLLDRELEVIQNQRVGLITNQTGVDANGTHVIDLLFRAPGVKLVALFAPEHGIRGDVEGGATINDQQDPQTGVPIFSIYGATNKPTPEMLAGVDVLVFDIQDVGTRFYTYISTMSLCMEAAAENNIHFVVLDRPNPITGAMVEGPVLEPEHASFVGIHPIALRHGMTIGELAQMFNEEGWLANGVRCQLTVIPLEHWDRQSWYPELGWRWIKPSPNMTSPTTALLYPGIGLLEACNVAEGRGTLRPFENIGAPWLDHNALAELLRQENIPGIKFDTTSFVPIDLPGMAMNPKYEGQRCHGLAFSITDPHRFPAVSFGLHLICAIKKLHPDKFAWKSPRSPLLMFGDDETPQAIDKGKSAREILQSWQAKLEAFKQLREKYLLYK